MLLEIGKIIKEYENGTTTEPEITNNDLYSINQVIELYPILSKHIITNGINDGSLKVTWIGNKRYFKLEDIDIFIKNNQEKSNNAITSAIASWREK